MLRSAGDADPATIFDHAPSHVFVDMHDHTEVADVAMASLPEDTFTHFRITLTLVEATVDATIHEVPVLGTVATPLDITYALSDFDDGGVSFEQGEAEIVAEVGGQTFTVPASWPVSYPSPAPGAWAESVEQTTWVTFTLSEPLVITPDATGRTYVITYFVADSFRWRDDTVAGYTDGEWDLDFATARAEAVLQFGANAFEISAE